MTLPAGHLDLERVAAGQGSAGPVGDLARPARHDVKAEDGLGPGRGEHPFLHHELRTPALARGGREQAGALLGRLEEELHGAGQPVLEACEHLGRRHEHRRVRVVAAGVHHVDLLAQVGGLGPGGEGQTLGLLDGQGVHVGAQGDGGTRHGAAQHGHHTGPGDAGAHLEAQRVQMRRDQACGADLLIAQLRMLVDVPAPADQLVLEGGGALADQGLERSRIRPGGGGEREQRHDQGCHQAA